jgi:hypothetical protein
VIAALTAAWSLMMPLANAATRLGRARSSQGSRSAGDFLRIMDWKTVMISRAATRTGTPHSIAATVTVSDLDRLSRPMVGHEPRNSARRGSPTRGVAIDLLRSSPARGPFGHDPEAAAETLLLQVPPQRRAVALSGRPLLVKPWQVQLERALPDAEDVRALTAQDPADKAAAVRGAAHDLPDRDALPGQRQNGGVGIFPAQISLVLNPLGGGEQVGIDRRRAEHGADLAHGFAHRIEEGAAGIFHHMPTIGDLGGLRQRLGRCYGVAVAAVTRDDGDLRLAREPGLRRRRFSIGQQGDGLAPFQVAKDGPLALVAPPCPVVDPDHGRRHKT